MTDHSEAVRVVRAALREQGLPAYGPIPEGVYAALAREYALVPRADLAALLDALAAHTFDGADPVVGAMVAVRVAVDAVDHDE